MASAPETIAQHVLRALMALSVVFGAAQLGIYLAEEGIAGFAEPWRAVVYGMLVAAIAADFAAIVVLDRKRKVHAARMVARGLVALLLLAFVFDVLFVASTPLSSVLIFQFVCTVVYQMANDPNLDRHAPREGGFRGAIPLSFFNLFWIFTICSVLGLIGETLVSLVRDGHWESRAGFVFGPFSPIYGVGAVLITAALNLFHDRNPVALFLIGGTVGAVFEYFAGWFFETAFGIVAWSYEGHPFNFHGHTSLPMAAVWGLIGLGWMKLALPYVMLFIDRIPLRMRVPLTAVGAVLLLTDAILTVVALDCWYQRMLGNPISTPWQELCAQHFDDEFMRKRFETMSMWPVLADR